MDSHEHSAVATRLAAIDEALGNPPTGMSHPASIELWRKLLEEKEQLEAELGPIEEA